MLLYRIFLSSSILGLFIPLVVKVVITLYARFQGVVYTTFDLRVILLTSLLNAVPFLIFLLAGIAINRKTNSQAIKMALTATAASLFIFSLYLHISVWLSQYFNPGDSGESGVAFFFFPIIFLLYVGPVFLFFWVIGLIYNKFIVTTLRKVIFGAVLGLTISAVFFYFLSSSTLITQAKSQKNTPEDLRRIYSRAIKSSSSPQVFRQIASNDKTPADVLVLLAKHNHWQVRADVSLNMSTPTEVLIELARDSDSGVKLALLRREDLPEEVLEVLSNDPEEIIAYKLLEQDTPDILRELSDHPNLFVRATIAVRKNTPLDVLIKLARDSDRAVRMNLLTRTDLPEEVLIILAQDPDPEIRDKAGIELKNR